MFIIAVTASLQIVNRASCGMYLLLSLGLNPASKIPIRTMLVAVFKSAIIERGLLIVLGKVKGMQKIIIPKIMQIMLGFVMIFLRFTEPLI